MTKRALLAAAVRPFGPGGKLLDEHMPAFNAFADAIGVPRDEQAPAAAPAPSASTKVPPDYFDKLAGIESGHKLYAKAPTSSGSGLYQFLKATWLGEGGSWGSNAALPFGGLKPTAEEQLARVKTLTAKNVVVLLRAGIPINSASLYAAHFFGAGKAAEVIGADVSARADELAGSAATKANPSILKGKTVGDFLSWLHHKTGEWAR
ncbi:hypothetical protein K7957_05020 [Sphingomonas yunnanensis]|nr:hypothetical protein [Sphingomonas yunnanensis]